MPCYCEINVIATEALVTLQMYARLLSSGSGASTNEEGSYYIYFKRSNKQRLKSIEQHTHYMAPLVDVSGERELEDIDWKCQTQS